MKNLLKKPLLLVGTLVTVLGLSFTNSGNKSVNAQSDVKWCDWIDAPGESYDGCKAYMTYAPCICEEC